MQIWYLVIGIWYLVLGFDWTIQTVLEPQHSSELTAKY